MTNGFEFLGVQKAKGMMQDLPCDWVHIELALLLKNHWMLSLATPV